MDFEAKQQRFEHAVAGVDLLGRSLYLFGEVTDEMATKTLVALDLFGEDAGRYPAPIHVTLNSGGGSFSAGIAIYDAFRASICPIHITVRGEAYSAAAIILQGGTKRCLSRNSSVMIHEVAKDGESAMSARRSSSLAGELERSNETAVRIFEKTTGLDAETVRRMLRDETFMDAPEALRLGFADEVES